jgi:hypothetical protein
MRSSNKDFIYKPTLNYQKSKMKLTVIRDNAILRELDSENMSEEQMEATDKDLRELLANTEVLEWKLTFKDGMLADRLNSLDNIAEFVIEQTVIIK